METMTQKIACVLLVLFCGRATTCFTADRRQQRKPPSVATTTCDPTASVSSAPFLSQGSAQTGLYTALGHNDLDYTAQLPSPPKLIVLLPAYNEVKRIGETLASYQSYLSNSTEWKNNSQILVVDDGSDDGTADYVCKWKQHDNNTVGVDCISLPQNSGKGAAVSFGIHHLVEIYGGNEPCLVLIADADGSADICCLNNMTKALEYLIFVSQPHITNGTSESFWNTPALINGYRGYKGSSLSRSVLRWGFRTTVRVLCGDLRVRDSQCGFKLMTLTAARQLYSELNLKQWSHDVEVLYRAREWEIPVSEMTVPWQDKEGSKLVESSSGTVQASAIMFMQVLRMRIEYVLGRWKLPSD